MCFLRLEIHLDSLLDIVGHVDLLLEIFVLSLELNRMLNEVLDLGLSVNFGLANGGRLLFEISVGENCPDDIDESVTEFRIREDYLVGNLFPRDFNKWRHIVLESC